MLKFETVALVRFLYTAVKVDGCTDAVGFPEGQSRPKTSGGEAARLSNSTNAVTFTITAAPVNIGHTLIPSIAAAIANAVAKPAAQNMKGR